MVGVEIVFLCIPSNMVVWSCQRQRIPNELTKTLFSTKICLINTQKKKKTPTLDQQHIRQKLRHLVFFYSISTPALFISLSLSLSLSQMPISLSFCLISLFLTQRSLSLSLSLSLSHTHTHTHTQRSLSFKRPIARAPPSSPRLPLRPSSSRKAFPIPYSLLRSLFQLARAPCTDFVFVFVLQQRCFVAFLQ